MRTFIATLFAIYAGAIRVHLQQDPDDCPDATLDLIATCNDDESLPECQGVMEALKQQCCHVIGTCSD